MRRAAAGAVRHRLKLPSRDDRTWRHRDTNRKFGFKTAAAFVRQARRPQANDRATDEYPGSFGKLPFAVRIGRQAFRLLSIMLGEAQLHRSCLVNLLRFAELPCHCCQAIRQSQPRRRSGWQQTGFALAYPPQPQAAAIFRRAQVPFAPRSKIAAASGPPLHFGP
mgnify:CR=1 FL=1